MSNKVKFHKIKKSKSSFLNYFRPSLFVKDYSKINVQNLKKNGTKLVICDLDNTLVPHFSKFPTRSAIEFIQSIQKLSIKVAICSNNSKKRVQSFCDLLKPDFYVYNAKKPFLGKIKKVLKEFEFSPEETIVIGDQLVTDIWLANRLGCKSILVLPVVDPRKDSNASKILMFLETMIYKKVSHKNLLDKDNSYFEDKENVLL